MSMPFYEVAEAVEVHQSTHFWKGDCAELALVLQRELGVTEDFVPQRAKFMQLTAFHDDEENGKIRALFENGHDINATVAFYDKDMQPCFDDDTQAVNFVI